MTEDYGKALSDALDLAEAGEHGRALNSLDAVVRRAAREGDDNWTRRLLRNCAIVAERAGDWTRVADYGERELLLQDDAYLRHLLYRAYEQLGKSGVAAGHLQQCIMLAKKQP
jgi:hypothetical protein